MDQAQARAESRSAARSPTADDGDDLSVRDADDKDRCPSCAAAPASADRSVWVACTRCGTWYHVVCVRVDDVSAYETWYCAPCRAADPELQPKMRAPRRRSTRSRAPTDYAALETGQPSRPLERFQRMMAESASWPDSIRRVAGTTWTAPWLATAPDALDAPLLVPAGGTRENPGAHVPGLVVPPRATTIRDVARLVGEDTDMEVMDVETQMPSKAWTLGAWADYFESDDRAATLNVISLEVSGTPMAAQVVPPDMVRAHDWVERDWPPALRRTDTPGAAAAWPKVQRYVLMGVAGAFTDFHVDFAATGVFYHLVWGAKTFLFAPPTPSNLHAYQVWSTSAQQASEWLGHALDGVMRVTMRPGETMLIPPGWIHAVHTPADSLVVGGNFLIDTHAAMHFRLEALEQATRVPRKFRFPHFVRLAWYVAHGWAARLAGGAELPPRVREGLTHLCHRLDAEAAKLEAPASKARQAALDAVPRDAVSDPHALLAQLREHLYGLPRDLKRAGALDAQASPARSKRRAPS